MTELRASDPSPNLTPGDGVPHGDQTDVTHVRQARRGRHAFAVLTASTILALAAVFGVLAIRAGDLHRSDNQPASRISNQANTAPPSRSLPAGNPQ
ncbi:hypothetical protein ACO2Q3_23515 [Caulobacter sp. KR2-114]|uniref:hypothetical protein n=1 Tax=Caulobacter sp. KR2-114 TaxID=3400912 RepID=UPI003C11AF97